MAMVSICFESLLRMVRGTDESHTNIDSRSPDLRAASVRRRAGFLAGELERAKVLQCCRLRHILCPGQSLALPARGAAGPALPDQAAPGEARPRRDRTGI